MKLHVKYTETYPDTLPEFSIDMEEGELDEEDFDTIMKKVTEAVSGVVLSGSIRKIKKRIKRSIGHAADNVGTSGGGIMPLCTEKLSYHNLFNKTTAPINVFVYLQMCLIG